MDQELTANQPLEVAIVGGGWAGLAAGVELSRRGALVTLFEAAKQLGGRARRVQSKGRTLDNGQHLLIGAYSETLRLIRMTGLDPDRLLKRIPLELNYPGAGFQLRLSALPAPFNVALGLLGAKGSNLREKFAAVRFMRSLQASDYQLANDCTVSDLLDHHEQRGRLRRFLWEPLCIAALNTTPETASAQVFANVLQDSLGGPEPCTNLLLPTTDLGRLFPDTAAAYIKQHGGTVHLAHRVECITPSLEIDNKKFEHVILATAPQHASTLLAEHAETRATANQLATYESEPICTAYVGYPGNISLPTPMLGIDCGLPATLGQWVFDHKALTGQPGLLAFVLSSRGRWCHYDNSKLVAELHRELEQALLRELPCPIWHQVIREHRASFSCAPNLARPKPQTGIPGLWLAGDYVFARYPATLEGAVRSGVHVATLISTQY